MTAEVLRRAPRSSIEVDGDPDQALIEMAELRKALATAKLLAEHTEWIEAVMSKLMASEVRAFNRAWEALLARGQT